MTPLTKDHFTPKWVRYNSKGETLYFILLQGGPIEPDPQRYTSFDTPFGPSIPPSTTQMFSLDMKAIKEEDLPLYNLVRNYNEMSPPHVILKSKDKWYTKLLRKLNLIK